MIALTAFLLAAVPAAPVDSGDSSPVATAISRGDRLTLVSHVGPITIERPVTALQGARPQDQRIFVRTDDGEVFAATIDVRESASND